MQSARDERGRGHRRAQAIVRRVLLVWCGLYAVLDLLPLVRSDQPSGPLGVLVVTAVLFWPWILGVGILGLLHWLLS